MSDGVREISRARAERNASRRVAVPAALFRDGRDPPFVLFNTLGGRALPTAARTVYLSRGDIDALHDFLRAQLGKMAHDERVPAADLSWAIVRLLELEIIGLLTDHRDAEPSSDLEVLAEHVATFAGRGPEARMALLPPWPSVHTPVAHAVDTALYATALAASHGAEDIAIADLVVGGLLADIGKVHLPRQMLERSGPLHREEWETMHRHPEQSVQVMERLGIGSANARAAARSHHERLDGSGYPDGLAGDEIPIAARCLAIADAFSALVVRRPGRRTMTTFEALQAMSAPAGQFEPGLLRTLVAVIAETGAAAGGFSAPADGALHRVA